MGLYKCVGDPHAEAMRIRKRNVAHCETVSEVVISNMKGAGPVLSAASECFPNLRKISFWNSSICREDAERFESRACHHPMIVVEQAHEKAHEDASAFKYFRQCDLHMTIDAPLCEVFGDWTDEQLSRVVYLDNSGSFSTISLKELDVIRRMARLQRLYVVYIVLENEDGVSTNQFPASLVELGVLGYDIDTTIRLMETAHPGLYLGSGPSFSECNTYPIEVFLRHHHVTDDLIAFAKAIGPHIYLRTTKLIVNMHGTTGLLNTAADIRAFIDVLIEKKISQVMFLWWTVPSEVLSVLASGDIDVCLECCALETRLAPSENMVLNDCTIQQKDNLCKAKLTLLSCQRRF